jgi:hypothetical protein
MPTMPPMMAVPTNSGNIRCSLSLYQTNISGNSLSVRIVLLVIARFLHRACGKSDVPACNRWSSRRVSEFGLEVFRNDRLSLVRPWKLTNQFLAERLLSTGPVFSNVHKIRVESDNKRCA